MNIFNQKMSDYKVVDIIVKVWLWILIVMWIVGMAALLSHIITNPSSVDNASFGLFETLRN
jgi:hypothetical protein